ncbi:hypothetical protein O6H91_Y271700 [Diphasiastrum complanatum]|nr:hypothetical protein O6H91_Y271700 [Diphasiastrum complanatum]
MQLLALLIVPQLPLPSLLLLHLLLLSRNAKVYFALANPFPAPPTLAQFFIWIVHGRSLAGDWGVHLHGIAYSILTARKRMRCICARGTT